LALTAFMPLIHARPHSHAPEPVQRTTCGHCSAAHADHASRQAANPATPDSKPDHQDHQDGSGCDTCVQILLSLNLGGAPMAEGWVPAPAAICEQVGVVAARAIACEPPRDASPRGPPMA